LNKLEEEIKLNIDEQVFSIDIQFWSNILYNLRIHRCKIILEKFYDTFKKNNEINIENLKKEIEMKVKGSLGLHNYNNVKKVKYSDEIDGNLSPVLYESDEELRKFSVCEHDYLINISETRKFLLANQIAKWQRSFDQTLNNLAQKSYKEDMKENSQIKVSNELNNNDMINKLEIRKEEANNDIEMEDNRVAIQINQTTSDEEVEKFLNKNKSKNKKNNGLVPSTIGNEMDLLLGTTCLPTNTIKASRFYLKDDIMYDFNLTHEMQLIESQELGEGECIFNDIVPLPNSVYIWSSKYKPRKPRYFNRVRTGYEWNKYNQVHYDYDNPPPKVIQGYKFNIFCPDLIDKSKAPQYSFERADSQNTCIIRFHAGPPYEDIAFKIVNREWDMTEKAGFKNVFDRGILYLYFNFKRYRYKR